MIDVMDYTAAGTDGASLEPVGNKLSKVGRKQSADRVIEEIRPHLIRVEGTQTRAEMNQDVIKEYAERMKAGDTFPEPVVFFDGESYWMADGHHRLAAEKLIDSQGINCEVLPGDKRDALLYALKANMKHGLKRSSADKRHAIRLVFADEKWGSSSDRVIADMCGGVDHKTVASVRAELVSTGEFPQLADSQRLGADNKWRPVPQPHPTTVPAADDEPANVQQAELSDLPADADEFNTAKLEAQIKREKAAKRPKSGTLVVDNRVARKAYENLRQLVRHLYELELGDKYRDVVSEMIKDVAAKGNIQLPPVAGPTPVGVNDTPTGPQPF